MILDIQTVKAIGNKHYSILMESIRKSIVGGTFAMLSPNQIIGDMSPPSSPAPDFGAYYPLHCQ